MKQRTSARKRPIFPITRVLHTVFQGTEDKCLALVHALFAYVLYYAYLNRVLSHSYALYYLFALFTRLSVYYGNLTGP